MVWDLPIVSTPFPSDYRASGILLHITSLNSPHGIGDLGPSARAWVDRLVDAGQSWWQSLPFGPAGYGNSPYQPLSTFAGNELLISPEEPSMAATEREEHQRRGDTAEAQFRELVRRATRKRYKRDL
jgi:4-alpha-glucanotransferase